MEVLKNIALGITGSAYKLSKLQFGSRCLVGKGASNANQMTMKAATFFTAN